VLWPVFHYRLDLARFDTGFIEAYRRVNRLFAHKLMPMLQPDDIIWIHDYHLIPLAAELRAMGCNNRIGFFLHIPLPPQQILAAIPQHEWLMRALFAYDLVGFQSENDVLHFSRYVQATKPAPCTWAGTASAPFTAPYARAPFPSASTWTSSRRSRTPRMRATCTRRMKEEYSSRKLLLGVERLDYSKGLPQRLRAFETLLKPIPRKHPQRHADPDRLAQPRRHGHLHRPAAGTRKPVRRHQRQLRRTRLDADTLHPPQRGAQAPAGPVPRGARGAGHAAARRHEPGGQGIHRRAGPGRPRGAGVVALCGRCRAAGGRAAGQSLRHDGTADTIQRALQMPLEERRERHQKLLSRIREQDIHWWRRSFLDALREAASER
jgi:trehalose 6-phosphate synthase